MAAEIFVPFVFFAFLAAIILVPVMLKERTKRSAHDLISQAMARGETIDPALIKSLTENMAVHGDRARKSLGNGVILLALAGGFVAAFQFAGDGDRDMLIPAIIIGTLGAAFILLAIVDYATQKREA